MAGTMPHAIFVETDVDRAGLVGAYAAELPGCAVFAATDDGAVDTLDCGEHADDRDRAVLRPGDTAVNCERVRTLA